MRRRDVIHSWHIWMAAAYFALVLVTVVVIRDDQRQIVAVSEHAVTRLQSYRDCLQSIPLIRRTNAFAAGVRLFHGVELENAIAVRDATAKTDRLYKTRAESVRRLLAAQRDVDGFKSLHVPSRSECSHRYLPPH